jgi:hypothetical protein
MALLDIFKGKRLGRRRIEPPRDAIAFPNLIQPNGTQTSRKRLAFKPTPRNLRWFSLNPYARRAINAIKNPIAMLEWEVVPVGDVKLNSELERQIEVASYCIDHPNSDDSARTLFEQVTEDILSAPARSRCRSRATRRAPCGCGRLMASPSRSIRSETATRPNGAMPRSWATATLSATASGNRCSFATTS